MAADTPPAAEEESEIVRCRKCGKIVSDGHATSIVFRAVSDPAYVYCSLGCTW